ncbi:SusC/RagA family TonB-linked outer membrane protein [Mariniflexile sp. AS56]|uniref:SusC/RagA family TonB-linked outer membrane protein n=1 Tax=Mariniflexile sp. AS56 TaxID=3063957 RepID=UPI0026F1B903|nr:TonB-dependent receptor [Mariniflexile sp. AS56]MDO7171752.1 TonB-dependent receptor [Mariniflexile sp. AS56]
MKLKRRNQKIKILFPLMFLLASVVMIGQSQKTITGKVLSADDNMPLPGASVIVTGTNNGASTDFDGKFKLSINSNQTTLTVSYLGYKTKDVAITSNAITVLLTADASALDEIVVVGYGTQRKSDLINAVGTADLEKATLTPTSDVTEMLRGRIAGLQVEVGGGTLRPGGTSQIIFRGRSSIEGNVGAIYVVDGIIRDGGIEDINADDIKSIEVLKDASAQAIYGSRGANGVILVTTKRGRSGKVNVSYHGYVSTKSIERNFDVYSGQEFAQYRREALRSDNANDEYPDDSVAFTSVELNNIANNRFVDWEEELLKTGTVNSQSINVSGGTDLTKVYGSINYFKEDGIIPTSGYTRKNLRLNVDQEINDKFSVNFDLNLLNDLNDRAANINVITFSPIGSAYNDDGSITRYPDGELNTATNPLWNLREQNHEEKGNDFVINVTPTWQITDELQYQLKTNMTRKNSERGQYQSSLSSAGEDERGIARIYNQLSESYLIENILTYDKGLNANNKFDLTLVQSIQEDKYTRTFTQGTGFPNESLGYNGITNAIGLVSVERDQSAKRNASFMGRARYTFMDKYLFSATYRADGASVNAEGNKWSYNPAAAFAWKIHNESFLKNVDAIKELKLRVNYGALVNGISSPFTSLFTAEGQNYIFDGETASGYSPSVVLPNTNLKYEKVTTLNLGLDFSILDRLLTGSIEYYDKRTTDLLLRRPVPSITGYRYTFFNAGELQNKGLEIALTANIINTDDFQWSLSTNWSNNKNKLIELYNNGNGDPILEDDDYGYYVGQPAGSNAGVIRQFQFDGIFQVGDDFANAPQANPDSATPQPNLRPGDIRVKDVNGDGKITQEDRVFTDPNPDWFGSLSTTLSYKGFDLLVDFYAVEGATRNNRFLTTFNNGGTFQSRNNGVKLPYYTPENPSTLFPRPSFTAAPQYLNSLGIQDASYIRLRTLSLGYTLPEAVFSKLDIEQIKFYVTATNVFTKTDFIGYSPEVNIRDTFSNADTGYPDARSLTFGVKVNL